MVRNDDLRSNTGSRLSHRIKKSRVSVHIRTNKGPIHGAENCTVEVIIYCFNDQEVLFLDDTAFMFLGVKRNAKQKYYCCTRQLISVGC